MFNLKKKDDVIVGNVKLHKKWNTLFDGLMLRYNFCFYQLYKCTNIFSVQTQFKSCTRFFSSLLSSVSDPGKNITDSDPTWK